MTNDAGAAVCASTSRSALSDLLAPQLARFAAAAQGGADGPAQAATALRWLHLLHEEDAPSALALAARLERVLDGLNADGLGRWILAGLRHHATDRQRQRAWFSLDDAQAVAALHGEAGAEPLQRALPSLNLLAAGLLGPLGDVALSPRAGPAMLVQPRQQIQLNAPRLRPVLTTTHLLVPDDYTVFDGAGDRLRLYRAAVAHAVAHRRYSQPARPAGTLKPMGIAVVSAMEDARVEHLLLRDLPGVRRWFIDALAPVPNPRDLGFAALLSRMDRALIDAAYQDDNYWVNKARRLFDATATSAGLADYDAFRAVAAILANDLGQMRVQFNPQQFVVPAPYRDDHSYLWRFADAQTPPDEALAVQEQSAHAPLDASPPLDDESGEAQAGGPEMELGRFSYPEWDRRIERLRPDWCTVIEKLPAWQGMGVARDKTGRNATPSALALPRARRFSRTRRLRRQWEGDDVDLNAAIEVMVDRRSRLQPDPRLFMRPGRELGLSSILVLLDLSASANDRVGGAALSLLDIEKQAALLLAESVTPDGDRLAIHGFSSNTRAEVYYYRLLEFGTLPTPVSRGMIDAVQARFSTRMGAALRHATHLLRHEPAGQRSILLVTDGAPSDIDVHEPRYLTEDARAAVSEARRDGVLTHCIAVDAAADPYVRRIFGWRNYSVVDDVQRLPAQLQRACAGLVSR